MLNYLKAYILHPTAEKCLGRDIHSKLLLLKKYRSLSLEEKQSYRHKQLHFILTSANANVPYYRDLFRKIHFNPENILKSLDYLQEIPLLTKDILREEGDRLLNEKIDKKTLHQRKTNGSTGLVTDVFYDQEALDWTSAANLYISEMTGKKRHQTEAYLHPISSERMPLKKRQLEQMRCWSLNRINIYAQSYTPEGMQRLLEELYSTNAYSIQGHPSTLYHLALFARKHSNRVKKLCEVFESVGESINENQVAIIEETFGCKIYNRYGNAEIGVFAHSLDKFNELEVVDRICLPESHSLGNGLEEIIMTGLTNTAMPFIRYKTGDVGEVRQREGKFYIHHLNGRVHDLITINGTVYSTFYIQNFLEKIGGVDEFQIIEKHGSTTKTLKIVPADDINKHVLESQVASLFGKSLSIEYSGFDGLLLQGWRDKFRYLVREHS